MSELNSTKRGTRIELTEKRFGKLVVLEYLGLIKWRCVCDCGAFSDVNGQNLRSGMTKSCGCLASSWDPIIYHDGIVGVPLTQGKVALINAADLPLVRGYKWMAQRHRKTFYAKAKSGRLRMHKLLTGVNLIDHKNGNGLDNRRENLRSCTPLENSWNRRGPKGASGFYGVSWHSQHNKWMARITVSGRRVSLGYFNSETEAARVYDRECKRLRGVFAVLNFPA